MTTKSDRQHGHAELTVLSSKAGTFRQLPPCAASAASSEGELVARGDTLGAVDAVLVNAPCDAWVMDVLALSGEHVDEGQALFRIRPF